MAFGGEQSRGVDPSNSSGLVHFEIDEMLGALSPKGQRPAESWMISKARRHLLLALVADLRGHRQCGAADHVTHFQFKKKRIDLQACRVCIQSKFRSGRTGVFDREHLATRKAVSRQLETL